MARLGWRLVCSVQVIPISHPSRTNLTSLSSRIWIDQLTSIHGSIHGQSFRRHVCIPRLKPWNVNQIYHACESGDCAGTGGLYANQACCACGGGDKSQSKTSFLQSTSKNIIFTIHIKKHHFYNPPKNSICTMVLLIPTMCSYLIWH
jgi:hypothetical protein